VTYADSEQDLEDLATEQSMKSGSSRNYEMPPSSEYQSCIPVIGGKDRQGSLSLNTRGSGSEFPITVHERPDAGSGSSTLNTRTGSYYSGVRSIDNALQVNGTVGSTKKPDIGFHHYSDIVAEGNSRQINGNIHDAQLILSLLER
jgi:hypothetical protein